MNDEYFGGNQVLGQEELDELLLDVQGSPPDSIPITSIPETGRFGIHAGFFYPKLTFNNGQVIEFDEPCNRLEIEELAVKGERRSLSGSTETLYVGSEIRLSLTFQTLSLAKAREVWNFWRYWACRGQITQVVLDRFDTCAGQLEYEMYNKFFNRAICVTNPLAPKRLATPLQMFVCQLIFRQEET